MAGGAGAVLYGVAWALWPDAEPGRTRRAVEGEDEQRDLQKAVALGLILLGGLLLLREVGLWFGDTIVWPVALAALGSAVIWSRSDGDGRARLSRIAVLSGRVPAARLVIGALLVGGGMVVFLGNYSPAAARDVFLAAAVAVSGLSLIFGPWLARLARQLSDERRERIRSEERADMAAHLHDSVLQTLALIQRAESPRQMSALARVQERELRAWLFGHTDRMTPELLSAAIDALAGKVEELHGVPIETVVVGDGPLDERTRAVVQACGEAMINAARHSGADSVAVYVEVEPDAVTAYVRDEGKGFDPATVGEDRRGIADSIRGRLERVGGVATIASEPGAGAEVHLWAPRRPV